MKPPWLRRGRRQPPTGKALGRQGERLAARWLRRKGYRVLLRNETTTVGEADLVCLAPDGVTIVVVEVKTRAERTGDGMSPPPEAAITTRKSRTLVRVTQVIALAHGWTNRPLRIDVVAIDWCEDGTRTVRHFERALTARGRSTSAGTARAGRR